MPPVTSLKDHFWALHNKVFPRASKLELDEESPQYFRENNRICWVRCNMESRYSSYSKVLIFCTRGFFMFAVMNRCTFVLFIAQYVRSGQ